MPRPTPSQLRPVTSSQNALVKELRRAFQRSELTADGHAAIEGVRTIEEAIRSGLRMKAVFFSEAAQARAEALLPQLSKHAETLLLPDKVFESAVATETPQGVAALVKVREFKLPDVLKASYEAPVLVTVGIQDPGNLGTLLRSAEALGAAGVLLTEGTVSLYNSKTVRASAGSMFRLPAIRVASEQAIQELRGHGLSLVGTTSHGGIPLDEASLTGSVAIFLGNEGAGLPKTMLRQMDTLVEIPHAGKVESLNAAVAGSIVLYEAARQRRAEMSVET
ncbi:MAG: TrmH family RNA methyltransferase [Candidatus Korobacteraceae bacterium]